MAGGITAAHGGERGAVRPGDGDLDRRRLAQHGPHYHTATLLPNGKVLVAGGRNSGAALLSADMYDPVTNTWAAMAR